MFRNLMVRNKINKLTRKKTASPSTISNLSAKQLQIQTQYFFNANSKKKTEKNVVSRVSATLNFSAPILPHGNDNFCNENNRGECTQNQKNERWSFELLHG